MIEQNTDIDPAQLAAVQKGKAYEVLEKSEGYRLLLDYMERRTSKALKDLSDCEDGNDRKKLDLVMAWRESGRMFDEVQIEVARGIDFGKEALRDMQVNSPDILMGLGFYDGDNEFE